MPASDKSVLTEARLGAVLGLQTDWADFGSYSNGWAKSTGVYRYRRDLAGNTHVQMSVLTVGTTANGTTILSSANGLPAGFRIGSFAYFPIRQDNVPTGNVPAIYVGADGHFECYGVGSATRWDLYITFFAEN
jgi:hypothetical protein